MNNHFTDLQTTEKRKAKEIDLKELYSVLKRRYLAIVVFVILAGIAGIIQTMKPVVPLYQSSSRVIIGADDQTSATLQVILKDPTVLDNVVKELGLKESPEALAGQLNVSSIGGSQVVSIGVTDTDPYRAAKIADTTAQVFMDEVPKIVGQKYVKHLSNAAVNISPINPQSHKKILYYFIFGLIAGIGFGFLQESLDDSVRNEKELEIILEAPLLGKIPKMTNKNIKLKKRTQFNLEQRGESVGYE